MLNIYDNTLVTVELDEILEAGVDLWDFDYPIPRSVVEYNGKTCAVDFDRKRLQKKIEDHYRFRQIGQETVGRFKHYLKCKMQEIMPYYVQVYEFDAKFRNIEDPLESYNLVETFQQATQGTGTSKGNTSGTANNLTRFSDTPGGTVDNLEDHLTNATQVTGSDSGNSNTQSEQKSDTSHTLTRKGNIGVQPLGGEVKNIREAFINIDLQIIQELADLFLMVY